MKTLRSALPALVTAAFFATETRAQAAEVVRGRSTGCAFGLCAAAAGDVDQDGVIDLIVGSPQEAHQGRRGGAAWVFSGADRKVLWLWRGTQDGGRFGYAVAAAGDVDNDGYDDLIVGAPQQSLDAKVKLDGNGAATVYSGKDGAKLHILHGAAAEDAFGWSVAGVGDVDGDGYADFAVGAPFADGKKRSQLDSGAVHVYSGVDSKELYVLLGKRGADRFGWSIAGLGDVDRDGRADFVVGIEGSTREGNQEGAAQVFSGKRGRLIRTLRAGQSADYFGGAVAAAGDVDGDGTGDVIVGAWNGRNDEDVETGLAHVFSGRSGKRLYVLAGRHEHDLFGTAVGTLGDVDNDGKDDVFVGAPQNSKEGVGYVSVFSGRDGSTLFTRIGRLQGGRFGHAACSLGDLDKDTIPDLLIGVPDARRGAVELHISPPSQLRARKKDKRD